TLAGLSAEAAALVHELQNERASAVLLLGAASNESRAAYDRQTPATDDAARAYRLRRTALADLPEDFRKQLSSIDELLSDLPRLRDQIKTGTDVALTAVAFDYRVLIADLLSIRDSAAQLTGTPEIGADMRAAAAISNAKEALSEERVVVLRGFAQGSMPSQLKREFIFSITAQEQSLQTFAIVATADQRVLLDQTVTGTDLREAVKYEGAIGSLTGDKIPTDVGFTSGQWDSAMVGRSNLLRRVETNLDDH